MTLSIETAALAPTVEAGKYAALNAATSPLSVNTAANGLATGAVQAAGNGIGNLLTMAAPILPVAGVCMLTYMGIRTLIGDPVWPIKQLIS